MSTQQTKQLSYTAEEIDKKLKAIINNSSNDNITITNDKKTIISNTLFVNTNKEVATKEYVDNITIGPIDWSDIENRPSIEASSGENSIAEGNGTIASGEAAHAEGDDAIAVGWAAHAEGRGLQAKDKEIEIKIGNFSLGSISLSDLNIRIQSVTTDTTKIITTNPITIRGITIPAYIIKDKLIQVPNERCVITVASAKESNNYIFIPINGYQVTDSSQLVLTIRDGFTIPSDMNITLENLANYYIIDICQGVAYNEASHIEGYGNLAFADYTHVEGMLNVAEGVAAHAEGKSTMALGQLSHVEGYNTTASEYAAHAEGNETTAKGQAAHSEGRETIASGHYSHAGGYQSQATAKQSFAHGDNVIAKAESQAVFGSYNIDKDNMLFVIGNGSSTAGRSNAFDVDKDGNAYIKNSLHIGSDRALTERDLENVSSGTIVKIVTWRD